jgi:Phage portal protein, lambda family
MSNISLPVPQYKMPQYNLSRARGQRDTTRAGVGSGGGYGGNNFAAYGWEGAELNAYNFSTPPPALVNDGMGNYFEALRVSKDRTEIPYALIHLRPQILRLLNGLNRKLLSAIGRYLVDNGGVASYVVNQIADYCVPVIARSQCADVDIRKIYDQYFHNWCEIGEFTGRFTFDEVQRLICTAIDTEGDIGVIMTDESGLPQVRLYDTFHIGTLTGLDPKDGVEIDDVNGKLLGYRVVDGPVDTVTGMALKFIPSDKMKLLYDVERFTNYRGYSGMRRGSNDLRDKNDLKAYLKLKEKIGAALAAVIEQSGPAEEDLWGNDSGPQGNAPRPDPGNKFATQQEKKLSLMELLGGDIPVIDGSLKQFVAAAISNTSMEFMDVLDSQFAMGLGIPAAFFLDEKLTGPNVRSVLGKTQRKFDKRKLLMARFVKWIRTRVIAYGIAKDCLPATPDWDKISYQFTPINSIDLGDTMANERADVLCGQMSETRRYGNRGEDFEHEHTKIVEEITKKLSSVKTIVEGFSPDPNMQATVLPSVMSRFGLVGQVSTTMAVQEASNEQDKNNKSKNAEKPNPAKKG